MFKKLSTEEFRAIRDETLNLEAFRSIPEEMQLGISALVVWAMAQTQRKLEEKNR